MSIFDTPAARIAIAALEERANKVRQRRPPTLKEACQIILKLDERYPLASLTTAKEIARRALEFDQNEKA